MTIEAERKKLEQRLAALQELREAAGNLLTVFNKNKGHLTSEEQIHHAAVIHSDLNRLDQTMEDLQVNLDAT